MDLIVADEKLIKQVLNAAFVIHKEFGPGLFEAVYERALKLELSHAGLGVASQVEIPVHYRGESLGIGYRADIIVNETLLVELKCVDRILGLHVSQVITYLKLLNYKRGLLINFNTPMLKNGIKRIAI